MYLKKKNRMEISKEHVSLMNHRYVERVGWNKIMEGRITGIRIVLLSASIDENRCRYRCRLDGFIDDCCQR